MKNYLFLFRGGLDFGTAPAEQVEQSMMKWKIWIDELIKMDIYNGGERLTKTGTVIRGNKKQIIDGPYSESKEIVGGYISIKAGDLQQAIEISKGCPIFIYDGNVEIREVSKM